MGFLFIVGKILISSHLCYIAYHNIFNQITSVGTQNNISINIAALNLHERNTQFLNLYLNKIIAFCFFSSVVMIISKNLLPKFIAMTGIILWMYFGYLQQMPPPLKLLHYSEHIAILGGILFLGGSQYFQKAITLTDFKTSLDQVKKAESQQAKKDKEQ